MLSETFIVIIIVIISIIIINISIIIIIGKNVHAISVVYEHVVG